MAATSSPLTPPPATSPSPSPTFSAIPSHSPQLPCSLPDEIQHHHQNDQQHHHHRLVVAGAGAPAFHRFGDLPYEIRHMIWRMALSSNRGIHFMKLSILSPEQHQRNLHTMHGPASSSSPSLVKHTQGPAHSILYHPWPHIWQHFHFHAHSPVQNGGAMIPPWNDAPIRDMSRHGVRDVVRARAARVALKDEHDDVQFEPMHPTAAAPGSLTPILPTTLADDMSYFVSLDMEAAKLSATCPDAHEAVQRVTRILRASHDSLRLGRGGYGTDITRSWLMERGDNTSRDGDAKVPPSLVLPIEDVVYLEYAESTLYSRQWRLRMDIDCANLARVRHVALRYDPSWNRRRARCIFCKYAHWFSEPYPTHLYQFLSRYLPNLETFYFLDESLRRRRAPCGDDADTIWMQPYFLSKGQTYWVANTDQWTLSKEPENSSSRVLNALDWLRTSFREYASTSMYNRHANPQNVKFRVLAKENTVPPRARQSRPFQMTRSQMRAQPIPVPIPASMTPGQPVLLFAAPGILLDCPSKMPTHDSSRSSSSRTKRLQSGSSAWRMLKKRRQLVSQRRRHGHRKQHQHQNQQPLWESKLPFRFGDGGNCKVPFTFRCERARIGKDIGWKVWFDGK